MFFKIIIAISLIYILKILYDKYILKKNGFRENERFPVGTHVIISGGSKGIGKSLAKKFAKLGTHVTIIARDLKYLKAAKLEIEECRKNALVQQIRIVQLDLTLMTSSINITTNDNNDDKFKYLSDSYREEILGEHDRCDILINCCGSAIAARFDELTKSQFDNMMQVNYFSAVNLTRILLPVMKKRSLIKNNNNNSNGVSGNNNNHHSSARIVFVSSMCGLLSFFGYSAYSASKFALVGLAEALNMELKPFDIGVTISFPPDTNTPGFEEENKTKPKLTSKMSESGNVFHPDEVADSIIADIRAKKFYSTIGFENMCVLKAMNTFMPSSSFLDVLLESLIVGPLRLVGYFILRNWYKLVDESARSEILKAELDMKNS